MNTAMEFLLLSMLSYGNFSQEHYGRNLEELLLEDEKSQKIIIKDKGGVLTRRNYQLLLGYFREFLKDWKVFYVDNRTTLSKNLSSKASGFYAVAFTKGDKTVISYRGSEIYPIEDAYMDFIETDLLLGIGKRPKQFEEGTEVYKSVLNLLGGDSENISLTGHSLGGGIAQFVAVMADKLGYLVPYTCTWNALGINKNGILGIDDFIDFEDLLKKIYPFEKKDLESVMQLKNSYMDFLMRELKKMGYIKDRECVKKTSLDPLEFNITQEFLDEFIKVTKCDKYLEPLDITTRRKLLNEHNFISKLFITPDFSKVLTESKEFLEKVKKNTAYENVVMNFCHSKDLTTSLFNHVGSVYLVDQSFLKKDISKKWLLKNFLTLNKSVRQYHFEDVFLPFLITEGKKRGRFSEKLNVDFVASSLRKLIYLETYLENELLEKYFTLSEIQNGGEERIKELILNGLIKSKDELIYKEQLISSLERLEDFQIALLWDKLKEKLPSPYKPTDLYDSMIF